MIIGIAALFSLLFFGGSQEYFLIQDLEKGVKKYITDKERSKELTAELKLSKEMIKEFNKARKKEASKFHEMLLDRGSSKETMQEFFNDRLKERAAFQQKLLDKRISFTAKIKEDEWQNILTLSQATVSKANAKAAKKDSEDPFQNIRETIEKNIADQEKRRAALESFDRFKMEYTEFLIEVNKVNSLESELLQKRTTTVEEFEALALRTNELRKKAYYRLIDLHFDFKELTSDQEWTKIMKSILKNLT
jgi:hypothetical protein